MYSTLIGEFFLPDFGENDMRLSEAFYFLVLSVILMDTSSWAWIYHSL